MRLLLKPIYIHERVDKVFLLVFTFSTSSECFWPLSTKL